jgi:CRP/FNR family transcriptional regulator, nitrogen fixation regulation protein
MLATANSSIHVRPAAAPARAQATCGGPLGLMGAPMRFARNTEIYGEEDPADYLYQVVSGAVRTYRMLDDGRRQISAFYLPGDIFGVEAGDVHLSSAEAVCDAQVLVARRSAVMARADHERELSRQLWSLTVRELQRIQEHSMLLIKSAEERVAGFLLEMAGRSPAGAAIDLPMCRQDIADYLGLTIETVSRTFTQLVQSGTIALEKSRRIMFRNRAALVRLNA